MEKIKLSCAVLCEGKYDKIKLSSFLDAMIITTDGFGIFNNAEKKALLRRLCDERGLVIITDSDKAGFFIRNKLKGMLDADKVKNLYIPEIFGKEKRKSAPSKEGLLGVEGMDVKKLREIFEASGLTCDSAPKSDVRITKARLYELGLSGRPDSRERRRELCRVHRLPESLSSSALCEALEMLGIEI